MLYPREIVFGDHRVNFPLADVLDAADMVLAVTGIPDGYDMAAITKAILDLITNVESVPRYADFTVRHRFSLWSRSCRT